MKKNRALRIISTFTEHELKQFDDFLNSPFLNKNRKALRLFRMIRRYHPHYDISLESLSGKFFPNAPYKESYLRNLFSDLNLLAEKYLLAHHVTSKSDRAKFIIEELVDRGMNELALKKLKALEQMTADHESKDQEYYSGKIFISDTRDLLNTDRTLFDRHIAHSIRLKINLSLLNLLESYFQCAVEEQRILISHDFGYLQHSLKYMRGRLKDFSDEHLLMIYFHLWEVYFGEGKLPEFEKARKIFSKHFDKLELFDRKNIFSAMQTVCLKRIEAGEADFVRTFTDVLLDLLKRSVTSHRLNAVDLNLYRNVFISFFKMKDVKKLKKFVDDYAGMVKHDSRSDILTYSQAHLAFLERNFQKSLELSNRVSFNKFFTSTNENLYFKNDVRMLILKTLYELSDIEMLLNHADTYRHFLRNSRVMKESQKNRAQRCIEYTVSLARIKYNFDDFALHKLMKSLHSDSNTAEREWLIEKAVELSN